MGLRENIFDFAAAWDKADPAIKVYLGRLDNDASPSTRLRHLLYGVHQSMQEWAYWSPDGRPFFSVAQLRLREQDVRRVLFECGIAVCAAVDLELEQLKLCNHLPSDPFQWMLGRCQKRHEAGFTWDDFDEFEEKLGRWVRAQGG